MRETFVPVSYGPGQKRAVGGIDGKFSPKEFVPKIIVTHQGDERHRHDFERQSRKRRSKSDARVFGVPKGNPSAKEGDVFA